MKIRINRDNFKLWCLDAQESQTTKQKSILEGKFRLNIDLDCSLNQVAEALYDQELRLKWDDSVLVKLEI